ncbi:MAG: hypothetical protein WAP74_01765 [Patescibacteria group bacterium]
MTHAVAVPTSHRIDQNGGVNGIDPGEFVLESAFPPEIFRWEPITKDVLSRDQVVSQRVAVHCGSLGQNVINQLGVVVDLLNGHEHPVGRIYWCPMAPLDPLASYRACCFAHHMALLSKEALGHCYGAGRGIGRSNGSADEMDLIHARWVATAIGYLKYRAVMDLEVPNLPIIAKRYAEGGLVLDLSSAERQALHQ